MAKTSSKKTSGRSKRKAAGTKPAGSGVLERQIVSAAETLGKLVGQAESRWAGWKDQRQQVASALATVRDRATSVLSEVGSEVRTIARRATGPRTTPTKRATGARKRTSSKRPAKAAGTRTRTATKRR